MRNLAGLVLAGLMLAAPAQALDWKEVTTPKGLTLWVASDPSARDVAIEVAWRGGSDSDGQGAPAQISESAMALILEGAGERDAVDFAAAVDDAGLEISATARRDDLALSADCPSDKTDLCAALIRDAVTKPRFEAKDAERLRLGLKSELAELWRQPGLMASVALARVMLPGHPRLAAMLKPGDDPPKITTETYRAFLAQRLARDNVLITIAGGVAEDQAAALADRIFADLPPKSKVAPPPPRPYGGAGRSVVVPREGDETLIVLSRPLPSGQDDRDAAFELIADVLGHDGFGRFETALRHEQGLTYDVSVEIQRSDLGDVLVIATSVPNDKARPALDLLRGELERLAQDGVSEPELTKLRQARRAAHGAAITSPGVAAATMMYYRLRRQPITAFADAPARDDRVARVVIDDLAKRYFKPTEMTTVLVGMPSGLDRLERLNLP